MLRLGTKPKHRDIRNRRTWWQLRLEVKHRLWAWGRDQRFEFREMRADFADWRAARKGK